ncbi:MAG: hypothetical protein OEQ39_00200 [Gammaproteobacteria bacterium]|nr:hypothetical protein [Gammaproteobacteria bacterium]
MNKFYIEAFDESGTLDTLEVRAHNDVHAIAIAFSTFVAELVNEGQVIDAIEFKVDHDGATADIAGETIYFTVV